LTRGAGIEVELVAPAQLAGPLSLLEEFLREGELVSLSFAGQLARAVEAGDIDVLAARTKQGGRLAGAALLAFRPSISAGALIASIEDLYVRPDARCTGIGRALLEAVAERCRARGVSYVEVQTDDEAAPFYEAVGYEPEPGVRVLSHSYSFEQR
jgi:GNAT superfamily N-acetyltransferase